VGNGYSRFSRLGTRAAPVPLSHWMQGALGIGGNL